MAVSLRVDRTNLESADNEHVDYPIQRTDSVSSMKPMKARDSDAHGPFPTPVVTGNAEEGSASRTEEESEGDGGCYGGFGNVVVAGEGGYRQGNGVDWLWNCEVRTDRRSR